MRPVALAVLVMVAVGCDKPSPVAPTSSADVRVNGRVLDYATGNPISGATVRAAVDTTSLSLTNGGNTAHPVHQASATYFVTGLTAGSNVFTAKYDVSAGTGTFANRTIVVVPLP